MFNLARPVKPEDYLAVARRRKWWIIMPFVLIGAAGIVISLHLPKVYRSSTLILVVPQRVPEDYIKPTVTATIEERLRTISSLIKSRTNLTKIMDEFGLYRDKRDELSEDAIIETLRENIEIELKETGTKGDRGTAFEIFYAGKDPQTVMMVTNRLASLFIEQNLSIREQQAQGTAGFLAEQLQKLKTDLEHQEDLLTHFKLKHMGELPEQMEANLRVLEQLQIQYQRVSADLRSAENRRALLINQPPLADSGSIGSSPPTIETLYAELESLRSKYTDRHPDVILLRKRIKDLEGMGQASEIGAQGAGQTSTVRPRISDRQAQIATVEAEIRRLRAEEGRIESKIKEYENRIEVTPKREQELLSISRDYENTKELYQALLSKKLEAEQAMTMEERRKGEQFQVIDPAPLPTKPWKPDMRRLFTLSILLGLGVGCGLAAFLEYRDRSFKDQEDLEAFAGIPVLAVIPRIELDKQGKARGKVYGGLNPAARKA